MQEIYVYSLPFRAFFSIEKSTKKLIINYERYLLFWVRKEARI